MNKSVKKPYKKLYVEITNICNLSCSFCPKTTRKKETMSRSSFERILEQSSPFVDYIYFHLLGEPLLHPDFDSFVKLATDGGFFVNIVTNGVMAKNIKPKTLAKIRKITFSLHSFEGNLKSDIHTNYESNATALPLENNSPKDKNIEAIEKAKSSLTLEEYLEPIIHIAKTAPCIVELRLWNEGGQNKLNSKIIDIITKQFGLSADFFDRDYPNGGYKIVDNCVDDCANNANISVNGCANNCADNANISVNGCAKNSVEKKELSGGGKIFLTFGDKFDWSPTSTLTNSAVRNKVRCYGLLDQFGILVDGSVVPCCLDGDGALTLGNINETPLVDILNGEKAKKLRDSFALGLPANPICSACDFAKRFD